MNILVTKSLYVTNKYSINMLKICLTGIGAMGKNHARACTELETVELIGVADTDKQHPKDPLEATKKRWIYLPIVKEEIAI